MIVFLESMSKCSKPLLFNLVDIDEWDILKFEKESLVIAMLRGTDKEESHCVTVFENWIFDANFDYALPLSKDSLDARCSSINKKVGFDKVVYALKCKNYIHARDCKGPIKVGSKKKRKRKTKP